jgi:hypothetical protein
MRRALLALILLGIALLAFCYPRQVTPSTVQPNQVVQTYKFYMPIISAPARNTKRGLAMGQNVWNCNDAKTVGAVWVYDWSLTPIQCAGIESVPLIWGYVPSKLQTGSDWVMGLNEPDLASQGNLSPSQAVEVWNKIEQNFPDRKLVAPSATNLQWLSDFVEAYQLQYGIVPRFDALSVHCYTRNAIGCENLVNLFLAQGWSDSVWVSEFQINDVQDAERFIVWMNNKPEVLRYAWFTNRLAENDPFAGAWWLNKTLFDTNGITAYGRMYRGRE